MRLTWGDRGKWKTSHLIWTTTWNFTSSKHILFFTLNHYVNVPRYSKVLCGSSIFTIQQQIIVKTSGGTSTITIFQVSRNNTGDYFCRLSNIAGSAMSNNATLNIASEIYFCLSLLQSLLQHCILVIV